MVKLTRATRTRRRTKLWQPFLDALPEAARTAFEAIAVASTPGERARQSATARRGTSSPPAISA